MQAENKLEQLDQLINFIKDLINKHYYGEVTIKFEAGKIVLLRKLQNIKL